LVDRENKTTIPYGIERTMEDRGYPSAVLPIADLCENVPEKYQREITELLVSAPQLKAENEKLKADNTLLREALKAVYQDIELNNVKGGSDELNIMVQEALNKVK
jgi:hypothetical protein